MSKYSKREIISVDLGNPAIGALRKAALERLAAEAEHEWGGSPSIGRWLTALADQKIEGDKIMAEIVIKNFRKDPNFGWGYSFTPTGKDAYSIETPSAPDHTGSLEQIEKARAADRTWNSKGGVFYNTAWFYGGRHIVATWAFGVVKPRTTEAYGEDGRYDYENDDAEYGYTWLPGLALDYVRDEQDIKIRVE